MAPASNFAEGTHCKVRSRASCRGSCIFCRAGEQHEARIMLISALACDEAHLSLDTRSSDAHHASEGRV